MSLCDICPKPGNCCKEMYLSREGESLGNVATATEANISMAVNGWPFVALSKRKWHGFNFTCPMLTDGGRCSIYDQRPQLCRDYEAASDDLCVFGSTNIKGNKSEEFYGEGIA